MIEKRFRCNFQGETLVSIKDTQKNCNVNILQIIEIANALTDENEQLKNVIIGKIQYGEDLEKFAIEKGLIQEDWARFDDYD